MKNTILIVGGSGIETEIITRLIAKNETDDVVCVVAKIDDTDSGKVPEWVLLFKAGIGELQTGEKFLVDQEAFTLITKQIADQGNEVVFDYEHQTLADVVAPAAGWIKELKFEDGIGIQAKVAWNEKAENFLAKKEYKYFSPVFGVRKSDNRVVGLHSVALTNSPKTKNLQPIVAKLAGMAPAENERGDDMKLAVLIAKLGLPEDATEADVLAKLAELNEKGVEKVEVVAKSVIEALGLKDGDDVSTVVASIHALNQGSKNTVSKADFDLLVAKNLKRDVDDAVSSAMAAGKITPDQKTWAEEYATADLEGFGTFVAKAPVVVPLDKLPGKKTEVDGAEPDETTMTIAKSFGLTAEDLKKHG